MVIDVCGNWRGHLTAWHEHQTSQTRNFQLAAALLEGRAAGEVFTASGDIAVALGERRPDALGQQGPGILRLVEDVGARLIGGETVAFTRPGYAAAVLDYFWIDRQHLREQWMAWMTQHAASLRQGGALVASRIAAYVLRWCVRHKDISMLTDILTRWADAAGATMRAIVLDLLTAAALDSDIGLATREKLLDWSKPGSVASTALREVTAQVCGGPLGELYPKIVFYRLGRLAESTDERVVAAVQTAITSLWRNTTIQHDIMDTVSLWCSGSETHRKNAGMRVFLALAHLTESEHRAPVLLAQLSAAESRASKLFESGWAAVVDLRPDPAGAGETLRAWVSASADTAPWQVLLDDALVAAVTKRVTATNLLPYLYIADLLHNEELPWGHRTRPDAWLTRRYRLLERLHDNVPQSHLLSAQLGAAGESPALNGDRHNDV
jgi:hypothetical protein